MERLKNAGDASLFKLTTGNGGKENDFLHFR